MSEITEDQTASLESLKRQYKSMTVFLIILCIITIISMSFTIISMGMQFHSLVNDSIDDSNSNLSNESIATAWVATEITNDGETLQPEADRNFYIIVKEDGSFTGVTPCGKFESNIQLQQNKVAIGPIVAIQTSCSDAEQQSEQIFINALEQVNTGSLIESKQYGEELVLKNSQGTEITFFEGA